MNGNKRTRIPGAFVPGLPVRPTVRSRGKGEQPSGMVVVRLVPEASPVTRKGAAETLAAHARSYNLYRVSQLLEELDASGSQRLVTSVPPEKLLQMEREAVQTDYPPLHSLTQYWRVDLRNRPTAEIARAVAALSSLPEVDAAWEEPLATLPAVVFADDPYTTTQDYQTAAPMGIDARWMWTQPNGEGAGIGIVDVEGGWRVTHEDLAGKAPTLIFGSQYAPWEDHGTAVLGEIVAIDNTAGVVGSAPAVSSVRMSSIFDAMGNQHVTDALVAAVAAMSVGQILLIELQIAFLPVETLDNLLDVIRLATARGIIVVEAAGNGNSDLDAWTTAGLQRLNRGSPDFVDSGAIMVGASISTVPHERWWASNFGSRIDCYAWGENVTTTGYGDLDAGGGNADLHYTDTFQGTSSASPIIVSAAALVQSRYQATTGTLLSPGQMRVLLSDPATGTAQGGAVAGAIGVMPNLAAIVPSLGLVPDVYMRDALGDTGAIPWMGGIASSPDVIVLPAAVPNPQLTYGEGSGTENSMALGSTVESGQDNFIYVRVRNRGGTPAANVVATVYWSPPATLVTPSMWNLIGSVAIPSLPVGDVLTVSPALTWPRASIPGDGHYCFVATLHHANDPAPPTPASLVSFSSFTDLIRNHNNVTWRNFNVQNVLPDAPSATPAFAFLMTGAQDEALQFGFEVERKLPAGVMLELEGPMGLLVRLRGKERWELSRGARGRPARLVLPALPRIRLAEVRLPAGARHALTFIIRPGRGKVAFGNGVAIRQLFRGEEVGRVGWQFAPRACLCDHRKR